MRRAKIKRDEVFDLGELFSNELHSAAEKRSISNYEPHEKQVKFHGADTVGRLYIGGNRSGKSVGGVVEDIWWLTNKHPYLKTPDRPVKGRVVAVDFPNGVQKIILPMFGQWIPPSALINGSWEDSWSASMRTLTLSNGSFCEFMSYDQELDSFAGTSRDFVHFDEEPPQNIFNENKMRLIDVNGRWWITMTPVEGMTWVFEILYEMRHLDKNLTVIEVGMEENPYLPEGAAEILLQGLDDQEREARKHGRFVSITGLIFKHFNAEKHVIAPVDPKDPRFNGWKIFSSMDHGLNNPTAWLWHLISPKNQVITFAEHYQREWIVEEHARKVHQIETSFKIRPELRVGDPAIKQRNGVTGDSIQTQYRKYGIAIAAGNNDVASGLAKMNSYMKLGQWLITENCVNLQKEIRRYRWKQYESSKLRDRNNLQDQPQKKDDHAIDSSRYLFNFMPDLHYTETPEDRAKERMAKHVAMLNVNPGVIAEGRQFVLPTETVWTPSEDAEYL